jgi:hypothetical protein
MSYLCHLRKRQEYCGSAVTTFPNHAESFKLCYSIKTCDRPLSGVSAGFSLSVHDTGGCCLLDSSTETGTVLCTWKVLIRTFRKVCTQQTIVDPLNRSYYFIVYCYLVFLPLSRLFYCKKPTLFFLVSHVLLISLIIYPYLSDTQNSQLIPSTFV